MTPQEIAEVRPQLVDFAAEMLGGLLRKDQHTATRIYTRLVTEFGGAWLRVGIGTGGIASSGFAVVNIIRESQPER